MHCMRDHWLYSTSVIFLLTLTCILLMQLDVFAVLNFIVVGEATLSLLGRQRPFWLTHMSQATFCYSPFENIYCSFRTRWQHLLFTTHFECMGLVNCSYWTLDGSICHSWMHVLTTVVSSPVSLMWFMTQFSQPPFFFFRMIVLVAV